MKKYDTKTLVGRLLPMQEKLDQLKVNVGAKLQSPELKQISVNLGTVTMATGMTSEKQTLDERTQDKFNIIGNFIYGFANYSQARNHIGVGLEKSKGRFNEVYLIQMLNDSEYGAVLRVKDAGQCKKAAIEMSAFRIAVQLREKKPFKHPKQ